MLTCLFYTFPPSSGGASGDRGEAAGVLGDGQAVQRGERPHAAEDRRDGGQERGAQEEAGRRAKVQGAGIVKIMILTRVAHQVQHQKMLLQHVLYDLHNCTLT